MCDSQKQWGKAESATNSYTSSVWSQVCNEAPIFYIIYIISIVIYMRINSNTYAFAGVCIQV